jgi:hypothetical protein
MIQEQSEEKGLRGNPKDNQGKVPPAQRADQMVDSVSFPIPEPLMAFT